MPKLDKTAWENTSESGAGGDFKRMEPGIYDCIITGVETEWETASGLQKSEDRKCVRVLLDVEAGEFAGEYSKDFYADKPYLHAIYMSWNDNAYGLLKHTFHGLDEANAGFDAMAAFEADKWAMFIGKKCKVVWQGEERTNNKGYLNVNVRPDRIICSDDKPKIYVKLESIDTKVEWEDYKSVSNPVNDTPDVSTGSAPAYNTDDIPF